MNNRSIEWLVFDIDGVLIDVSKSFDKTVVQTVKEISGFDVESENVRELRKKGYFVDDFKLTEAIILANQEDNCLEKIVSNFPEGENISFIRQNISKEVDKEKIKQVFNYKYLGKKGGFENEGLWKKEEPNVESETLEKLEKEFKIAAVTGRNSLEIELAEEILSYRFPEKTTRDDVEKPDPEALKRIVGEDYGIFFGDSMNDKNLIENFKIKVAEFEFFEVTRKIDLDRMLRDEFF
jgi:phosphoglycolate phosphatase-like HAD superfamily hydrolase